MKIIFEDTRNTKETDVLEHPIQQFSSAKTSINSSKLPAIYKLVKFNSSDLILDFGGGKFDNAVDFVKSEYDADVLVYDPYNRNISHNNMVLSKIRKNGGADIVLNSNVLNVIKEPEARLGVLRNIKKLAKPNADIFITVYEGSGKGTESETKSGYQLNRTTESYLDEIRQIFPNASRKGKLIKATNSVNK